jgi:hypothetical protein
VGRLKWEDWRWETGDGICEMTWEKKDGEKSGDEVRDIKDIVSRQV